MNLLREVRAMIATLEPLFTAQADALSKELRLHKRQLAVDESLYQAIKSYRPLFSELDQSPSRIPIRIYDIFRDAQRDHKRMREDRLKQTKQQQKQTASTIRALKEIEADLEQREQIGWEGKD